MSSDCDIINIYVTYYICIYAYTTPTSTPQLPLRQRRQKRKHIATEDDDDNRYNYFYDVEHQQQQQQHPHTTAAAIVPKLLMKTNQQCQQTHNVWGIYELQRCNGEKIYFTCNNMGVLTRLKPYCTTKTTTLFYYNPITHHVWIAQDGTHIPYYLQEQLLSPQNLQYQLTAANIAPYHPIYLPLATLFSSCTPYATTT